jgi:hypothetical protein
MKLKSLLTLASFAVLTIVLASCTTEQKSPVLGEQVTQQNILTVGEKIINDQAISNEEINLFANGLSRIVSGEEELTGQTVGEIIDGQKKFNRDNLNANLDKAMTRIALKANHEFILEGIIPYDTLETSINFIRYQLTNKSDKDIKNLIGSLAFYQGNNLVKNYPLNASVALKDEVLKPGETKTINLPFDHDPTKARDKAMREQFKYLRPVWQATEIVFTDGETISIAPKEEKKEAAQQ